MLCIHSKVQDFGYVDEENCETDEIDKENMNEFSIFIAEQKSENTKHTTKYDNQIFGKFCRKKNDKKKVKDILFPR